MARRVAGLSTSQLVRRAREALGLSQVLLADHLGASVRTAQRWSAGQSKPSQAQFQTLAREIHPSDPKLADLLARAGGVPLSQLLASNLSRDSALADAVVCAAAEVMRSPPQSVRRALAAALARARALGLSIERLEALLSAESQNSAGSV